MIEISVDVKNLDKTFAALEQGLQNATPMMKEIAYLMNDAVAENFQQGGRPTWLGKKDGSPSKLQDTGRLKSSIVRYYDKNSATVGTNLVYAAIHQFGGKIRFAPRSGWTRLRTNAKGDLLRQEGNAHLARFASNGHKRVRIVRWTNHTGWTVTMPARPFLALTEGDIGEIEEVVATYLRRLVE